MYRAISLDDGEGTMLVSNDQGDYALLAMTDFDALRSGSIDAENPRFHDLVAKGLIERKDRGGQGLDATVLRTRKSFLLEGPSLHIFVVTLRCDHACAYCQVSRAAMNASGYDMSVEDAEAAIERVFESPNQALTIEFQGGEPTVRFDLIRHIVAKVEERNQVELRSINFSLVSTLHHLSDDDAAFCRDHGIHISTSIDGHAEVHNAYRRNPTRDSWQRTVESLERVRQLVGHDGVVAMPTLTKAALDYPERLVDTYIDLGFRSLFLRPMSPHGFAGKTRRSIGYSMAEFIAFYEKVLAYLLKLNATGIEITETYSSILLRHVLTPFGSNYVDLRSPAGAGFAVLVYNYDGQVYPADEARMAAESGDGRFSLGSVHEPLDTLLGSEAMRWLTTGAVAEDLPGCRDCAFVPFCGADPVYHATFHGDPIGHRESSEFCQKHMGMFRILFRKLHEADPETMRTFQAWAFNRSRSSIVEPGFIEA